MLGSYLLGGTFDDKHMKLREELKEVNKLVFVTFGAVNAQAQRIKLSTVIGCLLSLKYIPVVCYNFS